MLFYLLLIVSILSCATTLFAQTTRAQSNTDSKYGCLPAEITPQTIVEIKRVASRRGIQTKKETVRQRLDKEKARCRAGNLIDANGRKIRFYHLQGCWGNPPADHLEILERQRIELRKLKRTFTVIEISCNRTGIMPF